MIWATFVKVLLTLIVPMVPFQVTHYLGNYTTEFGSQAVVASGDTIYVTGEFVASENGTATAVEICTDTTGNDYTVGSYDGTAGSSLSLDGNSSGGALTGSDTTNCTASGFAWRGHSVSFSITSGTHYWPAINGSANIRGLYTTTGLPSAQAKHNNQMYSAGSLAATFDSSQSNEGYIFMMRIAYTVSGATSSGTTMMTLTGAGIR